MARLISFRRSLDWTTIIDGASLAIAAPAVLAPRAAFTPLLLAVPLAWGIHRWRSGRALAVTPLNVPLLGMAMMVLVSTYATYSIEQSLPKLAGMVFSIGLFFAVVSYIQDRHSWQIVMGAFLLVGTGLAAVGLLGARFPSKLPWISELAQKLPTVNFALQGARNGFHANEVAGVLLWLAPASLVALWLNWRSRIGRWTWFARGGAAIAAVLICGTLILTQSRSGSLGLAAALALMAIVVIDGHLPWRWRWRALLWVILALAGLAAAIWLAPTLLREVADSDVTGGALSVISLEGRVEIWSRAVYGLEDFPLTGMGMNTFRQVVDVLYPLFTISPEFDVAHAHNQLLQAGLDLGLPGLVAYVSLWLSAVFLLVRTWRRSSEAEPRAWALGLGAGLLGSFVYGLTDAVALGAKPGFLWWWMLALIVGLEEQRRDDGLALSEAAGELTADKKNSQQSTADRKNS